MRTLSRISFIVLVSLLFGGCATQYTVTQEELQRSIDQRLPVKSELTLSGANGELLAKTAQLDIGRAYPGRVALTVTGSISVPTGLFELDDQYDCAFSGKIRFNPQDRGIYLTDIKISSLEFKTLSQILPPQWYRATTAQARQLLLTQLTTGPIYTVQDKTFAESWFRKHGSAINVEQGRLVFVLQRKSAPPPATQTRAATAARPATPQPAQAQPINPQPPKP
ncbi:MAG TPA: DUF1439 domain-containing protein [Gallionellaceae bacterium]|nr:DUF1439 domain-containing protein [Gallionellaceae bacterium]